MSKHVMSKHVNRNRLFATPQYAGKPGKEAVMTVGFKWLEANHPQAFVEAVSQRLKGKKT